MTTKNLITKYLSFFQKKDHKIIPSASLVPENDPTVLFTTAGMHPLVPYLLGEPHPQGKRLASLQRCLRTDDITSVGDSFHHTFFLMLGNWSLGDYFKKEAISWSLEFLTKNLLVPIEKISVTVFAGDSDAPRDNESAQIWQSLGISKERIFYLPKKDNWWGPAGKTGPCGPDTEMFYDTGKVKCGASCRPGCPCGKYFEIWNDVFMQYNKKADGSFEPLKQKNVDTGMGVERTIAVLNGLDDNYQTELFLPIIKKIEEISGQKYQENTKAFRVITDHLRAGVFVIADSIEPSNKERGYILRRLLRRSIFYGRNSLNISQPFVKPLAEKIMEIYEILFPELRKQKDKILASLENEEQKFLQTITRGYKEIKKWDHLDGKIAFFLYETYGFPWELTEEIGKFRGESVDRKLFEEEFKKHQKESRLGAKKRFSGGLADNSLATTKLHTATHLLNQALREVLGSIVVQKGSNITAERLRFDFNYPKKLTVEDIKKVEDLVNKKIQENLVVIMKMMTVDEAIKKGAQAQFKEKYGEKVKVYFIGNPSTSSGQDPSTDSTSSPQASSGQDPSTDSTSSPQASSGQVFSIEICGGPHVDFTGRLGKFKIIKEESVGSGIRRIYGILQNNNQ